MQATADSQHHVGVWDTLFQATAAIARCVGSAGPVQADRLQSTESGQLYLGICTVGVPSLDHGDNPLNNVKMLPRLLCDTLSPFVQILVCKPCDSLTI